ncbi:hypothetical protein BASA81_002035 [Batrachochytrium salamandrivorans]|nr:hypothetical protein BASA81_002035 [Batrachochytrium salamandrivorans]
METGGKQAKASSDFEFSRSGEPTLAKGVEFDRTRVPINHPFCHTPMRFSLFAQCRAVPSPATLQQPSETTIPVVSGLLKQMTYEERFSVALDATSDSPIPYDRFKMLLLLLQFQREHPDDIIPLVNPTCFAGHGMETGQVSNAVFTCGVCRHRKPAQCRMYGCTMCQVEVCFSCHCAMKKFLDSDEREVDKMASLRVRRAVVSSMIQQRMGMSASFAMRARVGHDYTPRWVDQAVLGPVALLQLLRADKQVLPHSVIVVLCHASNYDNKSLVHLFPMELIKELFSMLGVQAAWFPVLEDTYY